MITIKHGKPASGMSTFTTQDIKGQSGAGFFLGTSPDHANPARVAPAGKPVAVECNFLEVQCCADPRPDCMGMCISSIGDKCLALRGLV